MATHVMDLVTRPYAKWQETSILLDFLKFKTPEMRNLWAFEVLDEGVKQKKVRLSG